MKKIFILSNLIIMLILPSLGSAHGNKFSMVSNAIDSAITLFRDEESGKVVKTFIGVKSWVDHDNLIVKLILTENKFYPYTCQVDAWKHENGEDIAVTSCKKLEPEEELPEADQPSDDSSEEGAGEEGSGGSGDDGHDHNH